MSRFSAQWFDGLSSKAREVSARFEVIDKRLSLVLEEAGHQVLATHAFDAPTVWRSTRATQRLEQERASVVAVDLRDRGSLQVDSLTWQRAWDAARAHARAADASGGGIGWAERMSVSWPVLFASAVLIVGSMLVAYRWGTPWAAEQLARWMPLSVEQSMTNAALKELDKSVFAPSKLPQARQAELQRRFGELLAARDRAPQLNRYMSYRPQFRLEFRNASRIAGSWTDIGANALAFPGGLMLVTDGLVELAAKRGLSDDALMGVIAHEVGHVVYRHGSRAVIEQGILNGVMGIALGDLSSILTTGAAVLQGLEYSRERETEADCYAVALMQTVQWPTAPMADLLVALSDPNQTKRQQAASEPAAAASTSSAQATTPRQGAADWLSSHPETQGRADRLRAGSLAGCSL
jgi:Zn-dependent protease with chaperone function